MKYIIVRSDEIRLSLQYYTDLLQAIKRAQDLNEFFVNAGYPDIVHFVEVV